MWVSKEKWEAMEKRIEQLESTAKYAPANWEFTIYKPMTPSLFFDPYAYQGRPKATISVKDVIERILAKNGMELSYVSGQPEKVEMQKKEPKK